LAFSCSTSCWAGNLTHAAGGPEAISFCNVFFFSSLICGLAMVVIDRNGLQSHPPHSFPLACGLMNGFRSKAIGPKKEPWQVWP